MIISCNRDYMMIVDDERSILRLFQMILASALPNLKIDLASNGEEALVLFKKRHHGVFIMDLHMPVMDGQMAFTKIQDFCKEKNWEMPSILFCTGYSTPDFVTNIVSKDSIHCLLLKPVSGETLVEAVKSCLLS